MPYLLLLAYIICILLLYQTIQIGIIHLKTKKFKKRVKMNIELYLLLR